MRLGRFSQVILISLLSLIIHPISKSEGSGKLIPVFVSIPPQAYLVERIGGSDVSVEVLLLPGKSPATYSPSPDQISKLSKAKLFFRIGVPFENSLIPKIASISKKLSVIDTRKGIKLRKIENGHGRNGKKHEGDNSNGHDPHTWLDPSLVKHQALTIYEAFAKLEPAEKAKYRANYVALINDLDALDKKIRKALEPIQGGALLVFHPAFGYFADAYGLKQIAVEVEGKTPKGKDLSIFIKRAKKEKVRVVFVQPQFDKTAALKIAAAINGAVVSIDPLERDYLHNLEKMAEKIARSFEK